jgi:glucans biosynthesis protein C
MTAPPYRRRRALLWVGVAAPVIALSSVSAAALAYPGFNHARQYLSELGGAAAPLPQIFNLGIVASGFSAIAAGAGFGLAILALSRTRIAALLLWASFTLAGIGMIMASLFPWPDPRHLAINLALGIQLAPILLIWGLGRLPEFTTLRRFLALVLIAMAVLTVLTKHLVLKGLVNDANVGWWERAFSVVLVGWIGVAAYVLERRLKALSASEPLDSITNS